MKITAVIRQTLPGDADAFDRSAVEAALRLKSQAGGTVTAICLGDEDGIPSLREALTMGCDDAMLIRACNFHDPSCSAFLLAAALRDRESDVVFTSCHAVDADTIQIGFLLAERLMLPEAGFVTEVSLSEPGSLLVKRQLEDQTQTLLIPLPCLLHVLLQPQDHIYPTMEYIRTAYSRAIPCRPAREFSEEADSIPRPLLVYSKKRAVRKNKTLLTVPPQEAAEAILSAIVKQHIL